MAVDKKKIEENVEKIIAGGHLPRRLPPEGRFSSYEVSPLEGLTLARHLAREFYFPYLPLPEREVYLAQLIESWAAQPAWCEPAEDEAPAECRRYTHYLEWGSGLYDAVIFKLTASSIIFARGIEHRERHYMLAIVAGDGELNLFLAPWSQRGKEFSLIDHPKHGVVDCAQLERGGDPVLRLSTGDITCTVQVQVVECSRSGLSGALKFHLVVDGGWFTPVPNPLGVLRLATGEPAPRWALRADTVWRRRCLVFPGSQLDIASPLARFVAGEGCIPAYVRGEVFRVLWAKDADWRFATRVVGNTPIARETLGYDMCHSWAWRVSGRIVRLLHTPDVEPLAVRTARGWAV